MSHYSPLFTAFFLAAVIFFGWSCFRRFRLVTLGQAENRFDQIGRRIWNIVSYVLFQRCSISRSYPFGLNHAVLFWCFMVLMIANTEFLLHGLAPDIAFSKLPDGAYFTLAFIFDIVSLLALIAVVLAVLRRLLFPPKYMEARSPDAFIILSLVALLMIAFFGTHAAEIAGGREPAAQCMPVSGFFAALFFSGSASGCVESAANFFWWLHAFVLLGFLNYLPYSKHMHILASVPNVFFRSLEKVTTQSREEFRKDQTFGAGQIDRFRWKDLFDAYACTECGRCSDVCPAANTGKTLNPRLVIHDIKVNLLENGPKLIQNEKADLPLIGGHEDGKGSVSEESVWACTSCGACMEVCPVSIEHVPKLVGMRRDLVEMKARFPQELLTLFENMEQRSNPWGIAPSDRAKWASEIDAKPFDAGKTEYLFYVGCAGAFDARARQVTLSVARILEAGGVSWGILGKDEKCCGDSLRRLGNEFVFDRMVRENVKLFQERGVKKIITLCPHCFSTLKNDYRQYGIELEVVHHTQLIDALIRDGKLKLNVREGFGDIVFHDSCYLGRYNEIYEAPRAVVAAVTGKAPAEMKRHHDRSFCCGAGGGRMWMEESTGKRICHERTEEALSQNAKTICVSCPYCMTMFEDGLKELGAEDCVRVFDLAEIVAGALK